MHHRNSTWTSINNAIAPHPTLPYERVTACVSIHFKVETHTIEGEEHALDILYEHYGCISKAR
jgi:hypothetical protein